MCTCPNYLIPVAAAYDNVDLKFQPHCNYEKIVEWFGSNFVEVPCGKCLECRQEHASMWADRCTFEAKQWKYNYFITLTYNDKNLPKNGSLDKEHFSQFIKSVRNYFKHHYGETNIRFFGCGEYSPSLRPHYHILLFNCNIRDLSDDFELKEEDGRYHRHIRPGAKSQYSRVIYDCWDNKGMITVDAVNYNTAAYVAGYVLKKANEKNKKTLEYLGLIPEFIRMSLKPGIGANLYDDGKVFDNDLIIVPKSGSAKISRIPRYYEKLLDNDDPIRYELLKADRHLKKLKMLNSYVGSDKFKDFENHMRAERNKNAVNTRNKIN